MDHVADGREPSGDSVSHGGGDSLNSGGGGHGDGEVLSCPSALCNCTLANWMSRITQINRGGSGGVYMEGTPAGDRSRIRKSFRIALGIRDIAGAAANRSRPGVGGREATAARCVRSRGPVRATPNSWRHVLAWVLHPRHTSCSICEFVSELERETERAVKGTAHAGKPHHQESRGRRGGPRCYNQPQGITVILYTGQIIY